MSSIIKNRKARHKFLVQWQGKLGMPFYKKQFMSLTRRKFLKGITTLGLAGGVTTIAGYQYGLHIEPEQLTVEQVTIPLTKLGEAFEGFKIVQLTDLHLQPYTQLELIQQAVALANSLNPDLVVLTGDYVFSTAEAIFELAPALANLNPKHGILAIVGNHDLWTDLQVIKVGFREVGIPLLINTGHLITVGNDQLYIAGLDDGWSGRPDLGMALASAPAEVPVIVLMHEPDFVDIFAQDSRVSLQLSGHTHGGQVRLPGVGAIRLPSYGKRYDAGLYQVNDTWLYTSRGVGVVGGIRVAGPITSPPIRINCPPEVTEIVLTSG